MGINVTSVYLLFICKIPMQFVYTGLNSFIASTYTQIKICDIHKTQKDKLISCLKKVILGVPE